MAISAFAAPIPLPTSPVGEGSEPTRGAAVVAGSRIRLRSALVWVDAFGDLTVMFAPTARSCSASAAKPTRPYVWAWIHSTGQSLPIGRQLGGAGDVRIVVNFNAPGSVRPVSVKRGVALVFTRVDTAAGGLWHGRLTVRRSTVAGRRFAFSGTFAGRWCGQR
jgi:hypothetical protein